MGFLRLIGAYLLMYGIVLFSWMIPSENVWENIQRFIVGFIVVVAVAGMMLLDF